MRIVKYDGPARRFQDPVSGVCWSVGEEQTVDDSTAERLISHTADYFTIRGSEPDAEVGAESSEEHAESGQRAVQGGASAATRRRA